jgi:hypothetical protein
LGGLTITPVHWLTGPGDEMPIPARLERISAGVSARAAVRVSMQARTIASTPSALGVAVA